MFFPRGMVMLAMAILVCTEASAVSSVSINAGNGDSQLARLSTAEIRGYFSRIFSNPVEIVDGEADVVLGTPETNPLIKKAVGSGQIALPTGKNQDQGYSIKTVGKSIYVAGTTDQGVLYGVYELLERYGVYFQISGERLPARADFRVRQLDVCESPVFKYRGLLPWDNFLCGMSGYDLDDYKELIDRAARMKLNMLQFHFYPGMAFFTEEWNGKPADPTCIGMPVDTFKTKGTIGEKAFQGIDVFGPKPYVENIGKPRAQAEAVQAMFRRMIDYSHTHGFKTCVGFELMSPSNGDFTWTDKPADGNGGMNLVNPLDPHNAELSVQRFRALTSTYPNSDFYWMWQSEARGYLSRNVGREPGAAEMRRDYAHWSRQWEIWGGEIPGGDIDYAYLFREVAKRLTPEERSRLATGGWSVDHLFPGIDPDFPKDIIFASLNSFVVDQSVKYQVPDYRVAKDGRRAWMIDWWEFDGEQWFPQFRVGWQEKMYKECADYGVESVSLLGWKLSGIEHNVRYLSEFAWNPKLTAKGFYKSYVSTVYGPRAAGLAKAYEAYDENASKQPSYAPPPFAPGFMYLSPGWQAMSLLPLPGKAEGLEDPTWKATVVDGCPKYLTELSKLRAVDQKTATSIERLIPELDSQGRSYAEMMLNRLQVRDLYLRSLENLHRAQMNYDQTGRAKGIAAARKAVAKQLDTAADLMGQCVAKYSEVIRNRGDQGAVAQMTVQYYNAMRDYADALTSDSAKYATIDWTAFRLHPAITFDFSGSAPWTYRDGKIAMTTASVDGRPTLKLEIGGDGTPFHSAVTYSRTIDLAQTPFLDFKIRTSTQEPLAMLFQVEGNSAEWNALNIIGAEKLYPSRDALPFGKVNDGKWHRITWDLARLAKEQFGDPNIKITSLIIGSWENPSQPISVEIQDFALGKRNTLD